MSAFLPDFLRAIVSSVMNVLLLLALIQPKYGKKITNLAMAGLVAIDLSVASYFYMTGNLTTLGKLDIILYTLLCFAIKPLFKDTFMQFLFSYITVQNVNFIGIILSYWLSRPMPAPPYANSVVRLLLYGAIILLLRLKIRPVYRQVIEHWNVFFYVAILIYINFSWYFLTSENIVRSLNTQAPQLVLLILLVVATYFSVFHALKNLSQEYALKEDNLKMKSRQDLLNISVMALEQRLKDQEETVRLVSIARHDHRHFSNTVLELLRQQKLDEAIHRLEQQSSAPPIKQRHFCENNVLNAAISYYANLCSQNGINLETDLDIPNDLKFDNLELAIAVSNLLENAIQACQALPAQASRYIHFRAIFTGQLLLELENPYAGPLILDEQGYPKATAAGHGIGTQSVQAFIEKQNGQIVYSYDSGVFRVRLMV